MGGRAGGGARAAGGGGRGYTYLAESDKAVKVNMNIDVTYSGTGRNGEWQDVQKQISTQTWIPKSQLQGGKPSEWIAQQKVTEAMAANNPNGRFGGMRPHASSWSFTDAKGKKIPVAMSKQTKARIKGAQNHDALVAQAKSMGIKGVHGKLKSSTLRKMIANAGG